MRTRFAATIAAVILFVLTLGISSAQATPSYTVASVTTEITTGVSTVATRLGACSGSHHWMKRTQRARNTYGTVLAWTALQTDFYSNGSRVTCSYSTRTQGVTSYGSIGGWQFKGWTDWGEIWYPYLGRYHGGTKTWSGGYFRACHSVKGVTVCSSASMTEQNYAHFNGTYHMGGTTS